MNRRALVIALLTALLGAVLLALYFRRFETEKSGGERVRLLTAAKPIKSGVRLSEDLFNIREVPIAYVEDRAIKLAEKNKVLNQQFGNDVEPGEILMWTDLAINRDQHRKPSELVQPSSRAAFLRASSDDQSFRLIQPGDYVDILATLGNTGSNERTTVVLMQRVLVLSVGMDTGGEGRGDGRDRGTARDFMLGVSVNLVQAEQLTLAQAKGKLSIVLRNPSDLQTTSQPIEVRDLGDSPVKKNSDGGGARPAATNPSPVRIGGGH